MPHGLPPNNALLQTPQTLRGWLPCCFATAASVDCGAAERGAVRPHDKPWKRTKSLLF